MSSNFWKFASTLEKEFHVPYDRDSEVVACPECDEFIEGDKWKFEDYTSYDSEGYIVYTCPICGMSNSLGKATKRMAARV